MSLRKYWAIVPLAWLAGPALSLGALLAPDVIPCGGGCLDAEWCTPALLALAVAPGIVATLWWLRAWRRTRQGAPRG